MKNFPFNRETSNRVFEPLWDVVFAASATFPFAPRYPASRRAITMTHWADELGIDPVVWATALFGVVTAAILVTAI